MVNLVRNCELPQKESANVSYQYTTLSKRNYHPPLFPGAASLPPAHQLLPPAAAVLFFPSPVHRERKGMPAGGLCQNGRLTSIASGRIALSEPCKGEFAILPDNRRRSQTPILASLPAGIPFLSRPHPKKNRAPSRTLLHPLNNF